MSDEAGAAFPVPGNLFVRIICEYTWKIRRLVLCYATG